MEYVPLKYTGIIISNTCRILKGGHRRGWWRKGDKDEVRGAENGGEGGAEEAAKKAPKAAKLAEATQDGENTAQEAPQQAKAPPEIVIDRE